MKGFGGKVRAAPQAMAAMLWRDACLADYFRPAATCTLLVAPIGGYGPHIALWEAFLKGSLFSGEPGAFGVFSCLSSC